jgi:hypothetical protein
MSASLIYPKKNCKKTNPEIMKRNSELNPWVYFVASSAKSGLAALLLLIIGGVPELLQAQTLSNDWSFNEAGGTTATDSVAGATIALQGSTSLGGGTLNLPGGSGNYAQLPNGILSTYTNSMTVETWLTDNAGQTWARAWSFGGSTTGPNNNFIGNNYIDLIPTAGGSGGFWTEFNHNGNSDAEDTAPLPTGTEEYATVVYDGPSKLVKLYLNGALVATASGVAFTPANLGYTYNNYIGLDQYNDSTFNGSIDELRIWNGAVPERYISASAVAGPNVVINNLNPTSATLTVGPQVVLTGTELAQLTVQLPQTGTTNLLATADATNWVSSNPSVLTVSTNGMVMGVGLGTATVSATIGGIMVTSGSITVTPQALQHEWSFNESGGATATDSVAGANITLLGGSSLGSGVLTLPGGSGNYAQLPNGILASNTSITIETWLTDNAGQTWSRAWSFGGSITGPNNNFIQNNYIDLIPRAGNANGHNGGMWTEFKENGVASDVVANANLPLPTGAEQYVVVTYNAQNQTSVMYSNGVAVASVTGITVTPASLGYTYNNYLGLDQYNDAVFNGTYDEMRIWNGAVTPVYIVLSAAAGPGVVITNIVPTTLTLSAGTSLTGSETEQATVNGNFSQVDGVTLTAVATNWTSSNQNVLTVNSNGLITAVSGGTATVSAMVSGVTATSAAISVSSTAPRITQGPVNQVAVLGDKVSFTVQALGGGLNFQWSFDDEPIPGATNSTLTLTNVSAANEGQYSVLVSNSISTATASATLTVMPPVLQHDWSFNENGGTTATDSIAGANITLLGGTSLGGGMLTLPGGSGNYAQLPNGILSTYSNSITIETWLTDNGSLTWARVWSFGGSVTGPNNNFIGNNYLDLIPTAGNANGFNGGFWAEFNHNGNTDAVDPTPLPKGAEEYATVVYDVSSQTVRLYLNGTQVATATNVTFSPASLGYTYNNFLGLDQYNDPVFNGAVDELRIWDGAESPLYMTVSAAAGPDVVVTNLTPTSISIATDAGLVVGQTDQAAVTANFTQISGVNLTAYATNWVSSDPGVLTVSTNGLIMVVGTGNATISAKIGGMTGTSQMITVSTSGPVITQQPEATVDLLAGATLRANVANVGNPPFTYFWFANGSTTPLSVSTSPTLTIPDLQTANAGTYTCLISNQYDTVTSEPLDLTVVTPNQYQQAIVTLGAVGYWPLNESSGTTAYDLIGGFNGTYTGGYDLGAGGPPNGFFGASTSAAFNGTSGYVDIPGAAFNITNAITVTAWVNLLSAPGFDGLFGHGDNSWRMTINPNGQPGGNDGAAQDDATDPVASPGVNDGQWHMVTYSYSGVPGQNSNGSLYVDGLLVANNTVVTNVPGSNLDVWIAGSPDYGTARLMPAYIANAAIFNEALTAAQVLGLYNGTAVAGPQKLNITRSGNNIVLTWQTGTLLQATSVTGPWTTNSAATSGYTIPATNTSQFFRLQVSP